MGARRNDRSPAAREVAVIFLLLFVASFKDDSATIAVSEYWSDLTLHPAVQGLKNNSDLALVPLAILVANCVLKVHRISFRPFGLSLHLLALAFYAAIRSLFYDAGDGIKVVAGFLVFTAVFAFAIAAAANIGLSRYRASVMRGITLFSLVLIVCNALNYFAGYGFVPGNPRMFGTASHPNFLGVQLAISNISILYFIANMRGKLRFSGILVLGVGVFLLILTGSRTGIVMCGFGSVLYLALRIRSRAHRSFITFLSVGFMVICYLLFSKNNLHIDSFYRGFSSDTRSEAWSYLWQVIEESPIFGRGYFDGFTENSYLRGWAAYGIVYCMMLAGAVTWMIAGAAATVRSSSESETPALLFALTAVLAIGAVFEGYLVDVFSFPLLMFFLLSTVGWRSAEMQKVCPREPHDAGSSLLGWPAPERASH